MPDSVEEMCPEMPRLDKLLKDVNDISESGARYSDMPQVWCKDGRYCIKAPCKAKLTLLLSLVGHWSDPPHAVQLFVLLVG